ncbi:MAG: DUF1294 domain-containing protein [Planctomycetota bacterium]|nr:DUF1294 domain-containing protein [Planctomycetota bacterium]
MYWYLVVAIAYLLASICAFAFMARDKLAARQARWRTPERTLHLVSLLGGWPGSFVAIYTISHKRRKLGFLAITYAIAILHVCVWVAIATLT